MKAKQYICGVLCAILTICVPMTAMASNENVICFNAEEFVTGYYDAINNQDWEVVASYYASEKSEEMQEFLLDISNQQNHKGLLNVQHVSALEIVEVDYKSAEYLLLENYSNQDVRTFIVGADYMTYEDTEYYAKGICYEIFSVVCENDEWKIVEKRTIWDFDGLLQAGYKFDDQYHRTEQVLKARQEGVILNYNGEYVTEASFEHISSVDNMSLLKSRASSVTTYAIPTDNTTIVYYNRRNPTYYSHGFHTMCKAITYAECGSDSTFGNYPEARKACIMAIKTYVWHFYIIQESKDAAYHVSSSQIAYNANYQSTYGFLTDYSAVQDIWMQGTSSTGSPIVFEANFKAGSSTTSQTAYKNGGDLKQLGCIYLLNHDATISDYKDLLHYYYDNSPRSQGGAVQFFDADKSFI